MTGNKHTLQVYSGKQVVAVIALINDQLYWQYHQDWLVSGYQISPHLPLREYIPPTSVQRFLRNMLPEGSGLDALISSFRLSKNNTFGLIQALGLDTPGSLVMLPTAKSLPKKATFRLISDEELASRLDTRDELGLIVWDGKPRLSVAGVQDKINVVQEENGQLGFGEGSLCSTHILKFERHHMAHLVLNEYVTMSLAKKCGLPVANVKLMRYGEHQALLVERFDRQIVSRREVKRRHIIDGCQALNLPPEYKYERNFGSSKDVAHIRDGASLPKLFEFANQCINPALAKQQMLDWVLFNVLTFNYDAHGKNISFFVGPNGLSVTPFYDLVNIKMYACFESEMAMGLGDEFEGDAVHAYQLADFADSCKLARSFVVTRLKRLIKNMRLALQEDDLFPETNKEEKKYLEEYHHYIISRCDHLQNELDEIVAISV